MRITSSLPLLALLAAVALGPSASTLRAATSPATQPNPSVAESQHELRQVVNLRQEAQLLLAGDLE